jgi:predicted dehydrogenase
MPLLPGGGIQFDTGSYYLSALINMLGPLSRVTGFSKTYDKEFLNVNNPRYGEHIKIETPNLAVGALEFKSGVVGTFLTSSEGFSSPERLEVHGDEGILICSDPNTFGGPVFLLRKSNGQSTPYEMPLTHGYSVGCNRGVGVAELAWSLEKNRQPRLALGYHDFEAACAIWQATEDNRTHIMKSSPERPAALPSGYIEPQIMETALAI